MRFRPAVAVCVAAVVIGCSAPPGADSPTRRTTAATAAPAGPDGALDCNAIGDQLPMEDRVLVSDTVALPDQTRAPALQTARQPDPPHPLLSLFAKDSLGFRAGTQWVLKVPEDARDHLRIGWGSPATASTVVRPPAGCPMKSDTGWSWYPGGYWTDVPGCYPVVVEVDGHGQRVEIGVGAPCPGQDPPVGRSHE